MFSKVFSYSCKKNHICVYFNAMLTNLRDPWLWLCHSPCKKWSQILLKDWCRNKKIKALKLDKNMDNRKEIPSFLFKEGNCNFKLLDQHFKCGLRSMNVPPCSECTRCSLWHLFRARAAHDFVFNPESLDGDRYSAPLMLQMHSRVAGCNN